MPPVGLALGHYAATVALCWRPARQSLLVESQCGCRCRCCTSTEGEYDGPCWSCCGTVRAPPGLPPRGFAVPGLFWHSCPRWVHGLVGLHVVLAPERRLTHVRVKKSKKQMLSNVVTVVWLKAYCALTWVNVPWPVAGQQGTCPGGPTSTAQQHLSHSEPIV